MQTTSWILYPTALCAYIYILRFLILGVIEKFEVAINMRSFDNKEIKHFSEYQKSKIFEMIGNAKHLPTFQREKYNQP